jgi:hypothetical protein
LLAIAHQKEIKMDKKQYYEDLQKREIKINHLLSGDCYYHLKEILEAIIWAIDDLKHLVLDENQKKIGMYEVYTNSKIKESFNKKEEKI